MPTATFAAGPAVVNILSADNFTLISKTGITNTGSHTTSVTGNIGSSPITAAAMDNVFCTEITGTIYGVDVAYTGSGTQTCFSGSAASKTLIDTAVLDMGTAYADAAGRVIPDGTDLYAGAIGGQTFTPGLYAWTTDVTAATDVTISGGASDVWIFQIAGNLNLASGGSIPAGVKINLIGGAVASNIFWQVGGVTGATLGTYSTFNGTILAAKQIILQTGAVLNGRAFSQTQITLDANTVYIPSFVPPVVVVPVVAVVVAPVVVSTSHSGGNNRNRINRVPVDPVVVLAAAPTVIPKVVAVAPVIFDPQIEVFSPSFPDTGLYSPDGNIRWDIVLLSIFGSIVCVSCVAVLRNYSEAESDR